MKETEFTGVVVSEPAAEEYGDDPRIMFMFRRTDGVEISCISAAASGCVPPKLNEQVSISGYYPAGLITNRKLLFFLVEAIKQIKP